MGKWVARVRFVDQEAQISWYLIEFDGKDRFFGLMAGKHAVAGEFSLTELESLGSGGTKDGVWLDTGFHPTDLISLARQNDAIAELLPPSSAKLINLVP